MDSGLRLRIRRAARHIGQQHRHITELVSELGGAIGTRSRDGIREVLLRYQDAVEAHFSLEDEVFFPALHGLHPEHEAELEALTAEHEEFRRQIRQLRQAAAGRPLDDFAKALNALVYELAAHEAREERIFTGLAWALEEE